LKLLSTHAPLIFHLDILLWRRRDPQNVVAPRVFPPVLAIHRIQARIDPTRTTDPLTESAPVPSSRCSCRPQTPLCLRAAGSCSCRRSPAYLYIPSVPTLDARGWACRCCSNTDGLAIDYSTRVVERSEWSAETYRPCSIGRGFSGACCMQFVLAELWRRGGKEGSVRSWLYWCWRREGVVVVVSKAVRGISRCRVVWLARFVPGGW
jgi:hypothetical protein